MGCPRGRYHWERLQSGAGAVSRLIAPYLSAPVAPITKFRAVHEDAVADFIQNAEADGMQVVGTEVSARTPFGKATAG